jgi:hypothetical protein
MCVRVRTCTASAADVRLNASEGRARRPRRSGRVAGRTGAPCARRSRSRSRGSVSTAPPRLLDLGSRPHVLAPSMCCAAQPARTTVLCCVSASVSERDKPRIKKNGKAQRHQGRIWYSRGAVSDGDLNTQRLALTSICASAKVPSAVCSASANQQPAASAELITDTVGSVLSVTASQGDCT